MSEWKEYKLGDIATFSQGLQVSVPKQFTSYCEGMVRFIRIVDVTQNDPNDIRYIPAPDKKYILKKGEIAMLRYANPGLVTDSFEGVIANNLFKITPKKEDTYLNKYLFYSLKQSKVREYFDRNQNSTTMPAINFEQVSNLSLVFPPLNIQSSIAEILSSLDHKIELNNKINQELESLAQLLFKRWFVDFEFPNENGEPYKSSGGEMVDSELGELPEGWSVSKFENLVKISTGKGINKRDYQDDGKYPIIGANGVMGYYSNYNIEGFKILTGRVGTLGTVRISKEKAWTSDNVLICEPLKIEYSHYGYFIMKGFDYNSLNRGSTQPLITQTDLKTQTIVLPQNGVLLIFQNQMDYLLNMIQLNNSETINLVKLRDSLLPKLISGELQINDN